MTSGSTSPDKRPRVAIIGGGVSGIACSWELRKHDYDVDIYESDSRLGGHANSVPFRGNGRTVNVDTGFIVMKESNYPQFNAFLAELDVETIPTDMSFGVRSTDRNGHEWSSNSIWSFIRSVSNLISARFWRLVLDIIWFYTFADDILLEEELSMPEDMEPSDTRHKVSKDLPRPILYESIGAYLQRKGYSTAFITQFLIPMLASPWCTDPDHFARSFPAKLMIQFMLKHGLLDTISEKMRWQSFRHGSKEYVVAFQKHISPYHRIYLNTVVHSVIRTQDTISLRFADDSSRPYDHVVFAIHANQALTLLGDGATALERRILSNFKTTKNVCVLHSDTTFVARSPWMQTAWSCFLDTEQSTAHCNKEKVPSAAVYSSRSRISVTFDINKVQAVPLPGAPRSPGRVMVTMNPHRTPHSQQGVYEYYHPLITSESFSMALHLPKINGVNKVSFAGAWMGFGFHEDGFAAGVHAARTLVHGPDEIGPLNLFSFSDTQPRGKFSGFKTILKLLATIVRWIT
ncbi:FAD/NAD(P)-binding domain-containing protein [Nemania sp. FL0916]|nr:FAD/NAD(P)-binding domain-containing protein [Nemania sp. FL0916]